MKKLKIGVIGTGHMGKNHVRNLADESGRFELVGIFDSNFMQADKIAAQYGTKTFKNMDELLNSVEAVVVAVPSSLHKEIGLKVAAHNVHALIEKPLAINSSDAKELSDAFKSAGLKLQVGHIERFNPVIIELDKILNKEQVFFVEVHRFGPFSGSGRITDASVVEDLMIHDIDLVCYLLHSYKEKEISGVGEIVQSNNYDFATCLIKFNNDAHAVISASRVSQNKERALYIHTEDSHIFADLLNKSLTISKNTDLVVSGTHDNSYIQDGIVQRIFVPIKEPLRAELIAFYDSVVDNKPIAADGAVGIRAVEICEEILKQIKK